MSRHGSHNPRIHDKMEAKGYRSAVEISEKTGYHLSTIHAWIKKGLVKGLRVGQRWYVEAKSLEAHLGVETARILGVTAKAPPVAS